MAGKNAGRQGSVWRRLREDLKTRVREQNLPCAACGQPIDTTLDARRDPNAFHCDHIKSLKAHPELAEDPSNLAPLHRRCNLNKGQGEMRPGLGDPSEAW